jgi:hypothetical protein
MLQVKAIQLRMGTLNISCHILCLNFDDNRKSGNGNLEDEGEVTEVLLLSVSFRYVQRIYESILTFHYRSRIFLEGSSALRGFA